MAWKRIDSIAKRVIDRLECDTGKGVDAPEPGGKVARPKPGQVNREEHHTDEAETTLHPPTMGRCMDRVIPNELPRSTRSIHLRIVEGSGRQTHSGGAWEGPAGHNALAGGSARRVLLKLVAN